MRNAIRTIKAAWNRTDTVVMASNFGSFTLFIGNCWWESVTVCILASAIPIFFQCLRAVFVRDSLTPAIAFGAIIGAGWPIGEGLVTASVGWWGEYLAPGPMVWHTPIYCMLIGWLASTHIFYVSRRTAEMGFSHRVTIGNTVVSAALLGVIGENLFVAARMWVYHPSDLDWFSVPAFVPIAYGIGYGILPLVRRSHVVHASAAVCATLLVVSVGLGLAVGFFPR
ncbi:MAG TPA: hypothetical protein PLJ47_15560 [Candidatus Hydrogenedentes bacterium]|nr:hypothetical protein [Candidatus Hydrogenedentota bacterium]